MHLKYSRFICFCLYYSIGSFSHSLPQIKLTSLILFHLKHEFSTNSQNQNQRSVKPRPSFQFLSHPPCVTNLISFQCIFPVSFYTNVQLCAYFLFFPLLQSNIIYRYSFSLNNISWRLIYYRRDQSTYLLYSFYGCTVLLC